MWIFQTRNAQVLLLSSTHDCRNFQFSKSIYLVCLIITATKIYASFIPAVGRPRLNKNKSLKNNVLLLLHLKKWEWTRKDFMKPLNERVNCFTLILLVKFIFRPRNIHIEWNIKENSDLVIMLSSQDFYSLFKKTFIIIHHKIIIHWMLCSPGTRYRECSVR